jgi:RNA polymerase sigma-70 factor (ECF subfamily)
LPKSGIPENNRRTSRIVPRDAAGAATSGEDLALTTADNGRIDPALVAALYLEHAEELRAFLIGVLRSGELAGEVLQATFAKAVESGHTAREESLKGWLFRVAYNEAMLVRRRQQLHGKSIRKLAWGRPEQHETPDDHLTRWETVARVRKALEELPPEQQQVVRMRIYEEKTFAAIADELSVPLGTVLTRMRLALGKLATHLRSEQH